MTKGKAGKGLLGILTKNSLAFFVIIAFFSASFLLFFKLKKANTCLNCNVVIIDIDTVGASALPCYGYRLDTAPNICSLKEGGVLFTNSFASGDWTVPSMVSTLTGFLPPAHQFWGVSTSFIAPEQKTIQKIFKENGYSTNLVINSDVYVNSFMYNMSEGFDQAPVLPISDWKDYIKLLNERKEPSFVYFYSDPVHLPYTLPADKKLLEEVEIPPDYATTPEEFVYYFGRYLYENKYEIFTQKAISENQELFSSPFDGIKAIRIMDFYDKNDNNFEIVATAASANKLYYLQEIEKYGEDYVKYIRGAYDARLKEFDNELKDLIEYLTSESVSKNTIVVFTSEHGEAFGEHGIYFHGNNLYNEILKVPLIIRAPGVTQKTITATVRDIDFMPTILDIVGLKKPENIQGVSFKGLLGNKPESTKRYAYAQVGRKAYKTSVQNEEWKLITSKNKDESFDYELYNLIKDPEEKGNVYENNMDVAEFLIKKTEEILKDSERFMVNNTIPFPDYIDEEKLDELMKRGYF